MHVLAVLFMHQLACMFGADGLRGLKIRVPEASRSGGAAVSLLCEYDLEGAALYSIRWYLRDEEFYRYVPRESPPARVFPVPGLRVDVSKSDERGVRMRTVRGEHEHLSGLYKCEVSADAPLFHTDIRSAYMVVAEVPDEGPRLTTEAMRATPGSRLRAECTAPAAAAPPVNITWYVNGQQVRPPGDGVQVNETERASRLSMDVTASSFRDGRLRLRCVATQYALYRKSDELELTEDVPQIALVVGATLDRRQNAGAGAALSRSCLIVVIATTLRFRFKLVDVTIC